MSKPSLLDRYLQQYAASGRWKLVAAPAGNISQVVVIPAYAEREMLFSTLASLARNDPQSLQYSFVLCVVNNKKDSPDEVKTNNLQTMEYLRLLAKRKHPNSFPAHKDLKENLQTISAAGLKLGYIDASTAGLEIPANAGGVGTARKIGMDMALRLLQNDTPERKLILSLDADTSVQSNYLLSVKNYFNRKVMTAIVAYEHAEPASDNEKAAIYCYEIFLRYWVLGLQYAKSPYAFHSIGSTIVCSTEAYLAVRGMNRREAGEDFYFLNKLAKIGDIGYVKETCVYPSARPSFRVPFGTGKRIQRFLAGAQEEYVLYNPRIFGILAAWLSLMKNPFPRNEKEILQKAAIIDPLLSTFLRDCQFAEAWSKISRNVKDENNLIRHFSGWFDGFKTLKLINYLSRESYAHVNMFAALEHILRMRNVSVPNFIKAATQQDIALQKKVLQYLRKIT